MCILNRCHFIWVSLASAIAHYTSEPAKYCSPTIETSPLRARTGSTFRLDDDWLHSAGISSGRIFRRVTRAGTVWGSGLNEKVVWHVVRQYARKAGSGEYTQLLQDHGVQISMVPEGQSMGQRGL